MNRGTRPPLPIDDVLPALSAALQRRSSAVLQAPPGAGKTTRVPLALLGSPWLDDRRVVMLEPRRIATRAAARRMASSLGEAVGETVGFRVRGETRVSRATRIEVVTEGVLTRMLQSDPTLEGVGCVIFDEFHERSLQGDLGLALVLQTQELLRPELRVLVMSATLDVAPVAALLGDAPLVVSEGRAHPVDVRHLAPRPGQTVEGAVASAVRTALARDEGSLLVFLPGAAEIRRVASALAREESPTLRVMPLYGDLPAAAQDDAIAPPPAGVRKVVLATSIAETSLTIDGVRIVVDSGVARVPKFSPRSGMSRLETVRVSRASATQRAGRAGRTAPGVCYRLWAEADDAQLLDRAAPEVLEADLTALALDLAVLGVADAAALRWLDVPPAAAMSQAKALLRSLGALDDAGEITARGREMAALGVHPRLACMLVRGRELGLGVTACAMAALLDERDIVRRAPERRDVDLRSRLAILNGHSHGELEVDRDAVRRVRESARRLRDALGISRDAALDEDAAGRLVALAYPDRVAQRRADSRDRYLLRGGAGAILADAGTLAGADYLAIAELDGRQPHARIWSAAPLDESEVRALYGSDVVVSARVAFDEPSGAVRAIRTEQLGALVLRQSRGGKVSDEQAAAALLEAVRAGAIVLPFTDAVRRLQARIAFVSRHFAGWPDVSDDALRARVDEWPPELLAGCRRGDDVARVDLAETLRRELGWERTRALDDLAPAHVVVPTSSSIPVDYSDPDAPTVAVRLQELFGLAETPRLAGGRVPVTLQLLSPAHRPVQVTRDLAGFWRTSYFAVRKDLRGRYPRHEWPEDPLAAAPTRRAKPRRS